MRIRQKRVVIILSILGGVAVLVGILAIFIWRSPPFYTAYENRELLAPILTMEQYGRLGGEHARPYIVEINLPTSGVLLYGSTHAKNPDDPQLEDIRSRWKEFQPTVALVEGRLGFLIPWLMDPVRKFGEMGAVNDLARSDGIQVYSWEPPIEIEIQRILKRFPVDRVALLYVLRPYFGNYRHGPPADPDAYVESFRRKRTQYPGLESALKSMAEIDDLWQRDFPEEKDWRETSDEYGLPGYLAEIAAHSNAVRDEHFAQVIVDLVARGNKVFAIAGSSHSVKLEPALRATLKGLRE